MKTHYRAQNSPKGYGSSVICDVIPGQSYFAENELVRAETMPEKCVVFGCSNVRNKEKGIKLHPIPFYGKSDPEKKRRRKKWVNFVKLKHAYWEPAEHSAVCSVHLEDEDFTNRFCEDLDRRLKRDEIGVCVFEFGESSTSNL